MGQLNATQLKQIARTWSLANFNQTVSGCAIYNSDDLVAAAQALDNAFDTTLTAAVNAVGGGTTVINGLAASIPSPFSGASAAQKTTLCCYVLMKRAGLI